jgi:hypothetical protein
MAQFGASIQTAQVTTGNFRTTIDPYVSGYAGYPNNPGARNQVGAAYYDSTGSLSNPYGVPGKYRYVRYNSTSNPALTSVTGPFIVFWTDTTFTTVSPVESEAAFTGISAVAGLCMPNVTALTTLTATILNGNYCWIAVGGYESGMYISSATVTAGESLVASATTFLPTATAAGTAAPSARGALAVAYSASASNLCNVLVTLES